MANVAEVTARYVWDLGNEDAVTWLRAWESADNAVWVSVDEVWDADLGWVYEDEVVERGTNVVDA